LFFLRKFKRKNKHDTNVKAEASASALLHDISDIGCSTCLGFLAMEEHVRGLSKASSKKLLNRRDVFVKRTKELPARRKNSRGGLGHEMILYHTCKTPM
jgi:hypothetical protein